MFYKSPEKMLRRPGFDTKISLMELALVEIQGDSDESPLQQFLLSISEPLS